MATQMSPGAIFSPSQARQQQNEAKEWSYVDSWLASKFGHTAPPPSFERTPETLQALLALAAFNESADESKQLLMHVESQALVELQTKAETDPDADILEALEDNLTRDGRQSLDAMAGLSVALGMTSVEAADLAQGIIGLTAAEACLEQQAQRVSTLQQTLDTELFQSQSTLAHIQSPAFAAPAALPQKAADHARTTKQLAAKLAEYRDRLAVTSQSQPPALTLPHLIAREQDVRGLRRAVLAAEQRVAAFRGLPAGRAGARAELQRARRELARLQRTRDGLFEALVEGEQR